MTQELSNEEIVTNLLVEKELLTPCTKSSYISNPGRKLSDFLADANKLTSAKVSKYSFIQEGLWKF